MRAVLAVSLLLSAVAAQAQGQADPGDKPRLALLQLRSSPKAAQLASAIGGVVANELERLGVFEVSTTDQVQALLTMERQRQLLGIEDSGKTMAAVGEILKTRYLVTGELLHLKARDGTSSLSLTLVLLDAKQGKRVSSELVTVKSEGELVEAVSPAILKLCSKVLAGRTGTLYVNVSEAGAAVSVDGVLRGTTPLQGRLEVPGGPHLVRVEKEGFVARHQEVRITPGEHQEAQVTLVPSPDFIRAYETRATRMRLGAYLATAVAAVGLGTAGYFQYSATRLYGAADREGTFAFHQALLNQGREDSGEVDHRAEAHRLRTEIENAQRFTLIAAGAGAAAAVTATVLYLAGDPPGRYQRYEVIVEGAQVALTPRGAYGALSFRF